MSQILGLEDSVDGVFIHPTAEIGDFVEIEGPCYIGKNCEIRHSAFLRKGSWICEDSVVGHSIESPMGDFHLPKPEDPRICQYLVPETERPEGPLKLASSNSQ